MLRAASSAHNCDSDKKKNLIKKTTSRFILGPRSMMQEALADISHQEENRSVLFSINSQSDAGGESEAQRRVDGCLGHF